MSVLVVFDDLLSVIEPVSGKKRKFFTEDELLAGHLYTADEVLLKLIPILGAEYLFN